jgi:hypothetical protein
MFSNIRLQSTLISLWRVLLIDFILIFIKLFLELLINGFQIRATYQAKPSHPTAPPRFGK